MSEPNVQTDLIAKKAALGGIYAAMEMHIRRSEELAVEANALAAEIDQLAGGSQG